MTKPLNIVDLAAKIGTDQDLGQPDWSKTIQRLLMTGVEEGKPLILNGHQDDPTILHIPETLRCVSPLEPYRASARNIHLICDKDAGLHWPTLGPGHDEANIERDIERAMKDKPFCLELMQYRGRVGLGGVGGHGWKYQGKLTGPKLPWMPWRSPSGPTPKSRNCLEGQAAFGAKDFGKERTEDELAASTPGWDLSLCDIGWWWGDAMEPKTDIPNDDPAEGLYVAGTHFHNLGRMGLKMNQLRGCHITWSTFGEGIPSSIIHAETGGGAIVIGDLLMDFCVIQSGADTVHISGEKYELENLTINRCTRRDRQHTVYIDMGPRLTSGPRRGELRGRKIAVTDNVHERFTGGPRLGYYQLCQDVRHTGNSGPIGRNLSGLLYSHGPAERIRLSPNKYRMLAR